MSFTEDELQAFNTILERRLSAHRQDMERAFEQRLNALRRELDERLASTQQDTLRSLTRQLSNQHNDLNAALNQKLSTQQQQINLEVSQQAEQSRQFNEGLMDRVLAAQLLGIEQLISQRMTAQTFDESEVHMVADKQVSPPRIEAIEVQTDLPWEDLVDVFARALDARFAVLNESIQTTMKNWEQYLLLRLHSQREQPQPYNGDISSTTSTQELIRGIEHLERINLDAAADGFPIVETAPLPAGAQFLNVIESVFSGMARAIIHNSNYASSEAAKEANCART